MEHKKIELAYWINEREQMRLRKESGVHSYSHDPAMAGVRYCNVHREDDKVTKWIAQNWRNPNVKDQNLTLAMVMARMINWPDTLAILGYPYDTRNLPDQKEKMKEIQGKKWTSAYTISTCGRAMGKEDYVFDHVLGQVAKMFTRPWNEYTPPYTLQNAHFRLTQVDGLGSFLAAQVIADLKNTPGHPLASAPDYLTWSAPGPGSLRGLAAYYGLPVTPSNYQHAIRKCYEEVMPLVGDHVGRIHMQDFQNCLCEFSKYMRVKTGDGRVRNKYDAG